MKDPYLNHQNSLNRLIGEYNQHKSLVIAYDFDNTVFDYHNEGNDYSGVIRLLRELKQIGCILICFTANKDKEFIKNHCKHHDIPLDKINENPDFFKSDAKKIYYNALLDDRAGLLQVYNELLCLVATVKMKNNEKADSKD